MARRKKVLEEEFEGVDANSSSDNKPNVFNDNLINALKTELGGHAYVLGKDETPADVKGWLSTGDTKLDMCISNNPSAEGGIPVGRLTEIHGEPSTGKSLLAYMILKSCADQGGVSVLIDTENAANIQFLEMLGLEPSKNLTYIQVDTVEDVFEAIDTVVKLVRSKNRKKDRLVTIVWDSIAATSSKVEMEEDVGNKQVAMVPRLLGQGLRKVIREIGDEKIALIFLNQMRSKIGVVFGDPMTCPGGNAVPFFASVRVRLYPAGKIKSGDDIVGVRTKCRVVKTRFGPPHRETLIDIYFKRGLVEEGSWYDYLKSKKLIKPAPKRDGSGKSPINSIFEYDGKEYEFKNKEFVQFMAEHPNMKSSIRKMIKDEMYIEPDVMKREDGLAGVTIEEMTDEEKASDMM